jgi:tetratricopeptide (TPR) repeat protein
MRSACIQLLVVWMAIAILPGAMASNARRLEVAPVKIPPGDPLIDELPFSPAERRIFADVSDGSLDECSLLTAALVACGRDDAAAIEQCRSVFDAAGSEVRKRAGNASTTIERIEIIHRVLHDRLLRGGYDANATDLAETLHTGIYNCASATVLWIALAKELHLDARAVEMPGHVRVVVDGDRSLLQIEVTCPLWPDAMRPIPNVDNADLTSATGSASATTPNDAHIGKTSGAVREISSPGLLAMIYYNRGIDAFNERRYADAVALNRKALFLDAGNQIARGNLLASINNWALALGDAGQFAAAESLLDDGRRFDPNHAAFIHNAAHIDRLRVQSQSSLRATSE